MTRGIFVSITDLYDDIGESAKVRGSAMLRNTTCCWWHVSPASAHDVEYAFGVVRGKVVSAYHVVKDADAWPVLPDGAEGEGRRAIPVSELPEELWNVAVQWSGIPMSGPVHYYPIQTDSSGAIESPITTKAGSGLTVSVQ